MEKYFSDGIEMEYDPYERTARVSEIWLEKVFHPTYVYDITISDPESGTFLDRCEIQAESAREALLRAAHFLFSTGRTDRVVLMVEDGTGQRFLMEKRNQCRNQIEREIISLTPC